MKILVGKTFGIGNAVMAIPMIKALQSIHDVDVLVGDGQDDFGAKEVLKHVVKNVYVNVAPLENLYDVAVMSIPFDGRWKNNANFRAKEVLDCRTRPDPTTFGFSSWKKHEIEYQMENAYLLGYGGVVPSPSFLSNVKQEKDVVFVGTGYKKDAAGFWKKKHWGNENYIKLIDKVLEFTRSSQVVLAGNSMDLTLTLAPITRGVSESGRVRVYTTSLMKSFEAAASSGVYIGNDTGLMHVAAAHDVPSIGIFMYEGTKIKNYPWCSKWKVLEGHNTLPTPEEVFNEYVEVLKCTS